MKFDDMKSMDYRTGLKIEAKATYKNPPEGSNKPKFSGKGVLYIDGKTIPITIGIWENNYGTLNIRGTKAWNKK